MLSCYLTDGGQGVTVQGSYSERHKKQVGTVQPTPPKDHNDLLPRASSVVGLEFSQPGTTATRYTRDKAESDSAWRIEVSIPPSFHRCPKSDI